MFPADCIPLSIAGTKLLAVDASAGACLTASLRTDGVPRPLPEGKRAELARGRDLARKAVAELDLAPGAKAYFERLAALADAVLAATG
jgi:hypothetical protein